MTEPRHRAPDARPDDAPGAGGSKPGSASGAGAKPTGSSGPTDSAAAGRPGRPARKPFLLRLPPELMAELRAWANQDLRSLNGHIEYLLREALRRRRGGGGRE